MTLIQRADPGARRKAVWLLVAGTLLGGCVIAVFDYFEQDLQFWLQRNTDYLIQNTVVVFFGALLLVSPLLAAAVYLLSLGNRIVRWQRFPPPGYAVYRDTLVLGGSRGIRRGRVMQLLSLVMLSSAGVITFLLFSLFRAFSVLL